MGQQRERRTSSTSNETRVQSRALIDKKKKPLSIREASAVKHYLIYKNKYKACIHAGYSESMSRTRSTSIFSRPNVADFIENAKKERRREIDITLEDQVYRINNIITTFDKIQELALKPKLGKVQKARLFVLQNIVKGTTILDAIKLQNELLDITSNIADQATVGPTFSHDDSEL